MVNFAKERSRDSKGRFTVPTIPSLFDRSSYRKEYYKKNRERIIKKVVEWGRKNKVKRKVSKDKWRSKNKERMRFHYRLRHYRKKNALGKLTFKQMEELKNSLTTCPYCGVNKPNTIDHVVPLSKGGSNEINNLIPVCGGCNSKKGSKSLVEWKPMLYYTFQQIDRASKFNK